LAHPLDQVARERRDATVARHICRYEAGSQRAACGGGSPAKADDPVETGQQWLFHRVTTFRRGDP
jgi:hypothetical protein